MPRPALIEAALLGAVQGPAELLPISSSGHLTLVPALLRLDYADLDGELRKSFEVALHLGTAAAIAPTARKLLAPRRQLVTLAVTAAAGLALERPVERRLSAPAPVAAAQVAAGAALWLADRRPQTRPLTTATTTDALWLGVAQACALVPGVSRAGATLTAARTLCFDRSAADRLSREAALPAISAAAALKGLRLARAGVDRGLAGAFATGTLSAFASTRAAARLARPRPLAPWAVYRIALGAAALNTLRR